MIIERDTKTHQQSDMSDLFALTVL